MKFSLKLLLCTMMVLATALGFSGYYFVNYVFETSIAREAQQALDDDSILRFAFETAALNVPAKYDMLQDQTVEQIASNLETGGQNTRRMLRLCDEQKNVLYMSDGFVADDGLLVQTDESTRTWQVVRLDNRFYIRTGSTVNALNRVLYLETMRNVSEVFEERELGFKVYRRVTILMLFLGALIMHFISSWLTRPIRQLTKATKHMAAGEYDYRARKVSNDELGQLTKDFNRMAEALENNMNELEAQIQDREDFVAAFAHELKTPLTSIIGYADMLRSRKLDEEKSFLSANYIYTEGKRLEAMSLRLLEIIVTKRQKIEMQLISTDSLFDYLQNMFAGEREMDFCFSREKAKVWAEPNLIKTVLVNLVDNACKASEAGGKIEVCGSCTENGYRFDVRDYGIGIDNKELKNITKAFYMVDKSRSRSKNGAGLGLALCVEILYLHKSRLKIASEPGKGSRFSFVLPMEIKQQENAADGTAQETKAGGLI
ncbi:MAG: ATP-binding protein [Eubacteriales bacterium]|nr:ATP-binding protein [Eubacteriales bacterium]